MQLQRRNLPPALVMLTPSSTNLPEAEDLANIMVNERSPYNRYRIKAMELVTPLFAGLQEKFRLASVE